MGEDGSVAGTNIVTGTIDPTLMHGGRLNDDGAGCRGGLAELVGSLRVRNSTWILIVVAPL
jgi:hypothetical protein